MTFKEFQSAGGMFSKFCSLEKKLTPIWIRSCPQSVPNQFTINSLPIPDLLSTLNDNAHSVRRTGAVFDCVPCPIAAMMQDFLSALHLSVFVPTAWEAVKAVPQNEELKKQRRAANDYEKAVAFLFVAEAKLMTLLLWQHPNVLTAAAFVNEHIVNANPWDITFREFQSAGLYIQ